MLPERLMSWSVDYQHAWNFYVLSVKLTFQNIRHLVEITQEKKRNKIRAGNITDSLHFKNPDTYFKASTLYKPNQPTVISTLKKVMQHIPPGANWPQAKLKSVRHGSLQKKIHFKVLRCTVLILMIFLSPLSLQVY